MRHSLCIALVLVLVTALPAAAQPSWSLEIVGGLNLAKLTGDDTNANVLFADDALGAGEVSGDVSGTRVGFAMGAMVDVSFTENVGLRSGLVWARKGGDGTVRVNGDFPGLGTINVEVDVTLALSYFEWPILGVVSFPISDGARVRMMAGPVFAFNTSADVEVSLSGYSDSEDISNEVKSVDIEGLLGAGVMIPVGTVDIVIDGSYSRGFSKIDDTPAGLDIKNSEFRVTAGVAIPIGPR